LDEEFGKIRRGWEQNVWIRSNHKHCYKASDQTNADNFNWKSLQEFPAFSIKGNKTIKLESRAIKAEVIEVKS
jgi:hypothetical protein